MAAFERFQALGEERFRAIINALMRGERTKKLARSIQLGPPDGWGEFQDVAEGTMIQQLNRLRIAAASGMYGLKEGKMIREGAKIEISRLRHVSVPVLDRTEQLSEKQHALVMVLLDKAIQEKRTFRAVNDAVNNYRQTLLDIQKMRFDLGLDEWKGPTTTAIKGTVQNVNLPDGTSVQRQVFEAVKVVEQIFEQRSIAAPK